MNAPKVLPVFDLNDLLDLEEFTVGDMTPNLQLDLDLGLIEQKQEGPDIEGNN